MSINVLEIGYEDTKLYQIGYDILQKKNRSHSLSYKCFQYTKINFTTTLNNNSYVKIKTYVMKVYIH